MQYLLIWQFDCETKILKLMQDPTQQDVFNALIPDGENDLDTINYFNECAEFTINNIVDIGGDIPVNLNDGDDTEIYYLIKLEN